MAPSPILDMCIEVPIGEEFLCESESDVEDDGSDLEEDDSGSGSDCGEDDEDGLEDDDSEDGLEDGDSEDDEDSEGSDDEDDDSENASDDELEDDPDMSTLSLEGGSKKAPDSLEPVYQHLAMEKKKFWNIGQEIRVRFLAGQGKLSVRAKVERYAKIWETYANIKFKFVTRDPSDIRISFKKDQPCHSRVGTDALTVKSPTATMNLAVRSSTMMLKRHVLHEFGHALGCIHEHSSPGAHIPWDRPAVYAYYKKKHNGNYSKARVDKNIFKHYDRTLTQFSKFDPHSIMIYPIPKQLTTTGFSVPWNLELSVTDKKFIGTVYPFPKKPGKKPLGQKSGHQGQASGSCGQRTSNICGNPNCGKTFICDADYNRQVQPLGYPGVRRCNPPTGNVCGNPPTGNVCGNRPTGNVCGNPPTGNICGNPNCGKTFICDADYNRQVQPLGYPGVRRC